MNTRGLHHVTAIASDAQGNHDFYVKVLGQRLVKRTVNFDDPGSYHLYFGDPAGSPGTIVTFFPWPGAGRGRMGAGNVVATAYNVPVGSLRFWRERLANRGVVGINESSRFGESVLSFEDPDGMIIELIERDAPNVALVSHADIPADAAIRGFHSVTLLERDLAPTAAVLTERLGYAPGRAEGDRHRFLARPDDERADAHGVVVDVKVDPSARRGSLGAGSVHHVAFRAADDAEQATIQAELQRAGLNVSPVMDRNYFHSIYFREPGGVLFEIATDAPGFAVDEPADSLGQSLKLPEQYEKHRAEIEKVLPTLKV
jgi:glyoxalase family protein